jgi:predicted GIY-YIG superfamily endonuclease
MLVVHQKQTTFKMISNTNVFSLSHVCYIIELTNGKFYIGYTNDNINKRFFNIQMHSTIRDKTFNHFLAIYKTTKLGLNLGKSAKNLENTLHEMLSFHLKIHINYIENCGSQGFFCDLKF